MDIIGGFLIFLAILLGVAGITFLIFWRLIPLVHVAVITRKGERSQEFPYIKREGWRFFMDFWPFFFGFALVKVKKVNQDIVFNNIRCRQKNGDDENDEIRSGGEISAKIGITWQPDYINDDGKRLHSYIDNDGEEGVKDMISDIIEEDVRQMGREKSWEEFTFGTDDLAKSLIKKLTGQEPEEQEPLAEFLRRMQQNGFQDVADLGIIIWRFPVGEVKEQGQLAHAAEKQAIEVQERRAEVFEIGTEIEQANALLEGYKNAGQKDKTFDDCLLEIRRRKAIREGHGKVWDIPGLEKIRIGR